MIVQKECRECGSLFIQYRSTQNICDNCAYNKQRLKTPKKIRASIAKNGKKTVTYLTDTRPKWFKKNPPSHEGYWKCYLRISPLCPVYLTRRQVTLDHVKPRGSNPSKIHKQNNLKSACSPCNELKGSMSLGKTLKMYPRRKDVIL